MVKSLLSVHSNFSNNYSFKSNYLEMYTITSDSDLSNFIEIYLEVRLVSIQSSTIFIHLK